MADALSKYRVTPQRSRTALDPYLGFAPPDAAIQMGSTPTMSAQPTGYAPPPETLAQMGQRGANQMPVWMADIENQRAGLSSDVQQGGQGFSATIARLKEEWKIDKARVMASPEYAFLKNSGLLYLIDG